MGLLEELAVRCEAATGNVRDTDMEWDIHFACGRIEPEPLAYTSSLDAAMTLVPEGWAVSLASWARPKNPGRAWRAALEDIPVAPFKPTDFRSGRSEAATPALALTAASLRARHALALSKGSDT